MLLWIFILTLMGVGYLFWMAQQKARDAARRLVIKRCREEGLQLLDDTLVLDGVRPLWQSGRGVRLQRRYRFEFTSTGEQRYGGELVLKGLQLVSLQLSPYRA